MLENEENSLKSSQQIRLLSKIGLVAIGLMLAIFGLTGCGSETNTLASAVVAETVITSAKATPIPITFSSGAVTEQTKQNQRQNMRVELDVFSGRPNPTWDLSSAEVTEFTKFLINLTPNSQPLTEVGLGYRGFIISNTTNIAGSIPKEVRVYNGVIRINDGSATKDYIDNNHQLELWLENQARQQGYGDIINWSKGTGTP
jgi:hypothetical protein